MKVIHMRNPDTLPQMRGNMSVLQHYYHYAINLACSIIDIVCPFLVVICH
jgi:hypothetical protein